MVDATLVLEEDPRFELVPIEQTPGGVLSAQQQQFRDAWLGSRIK